VDQPQDGLITDGLLELQNWVERGPGQESWLGRIRRILL